MASQIASTSIFASSHTFFSKLVEDKYHKNISRRPFCMEKGFLFQDAPFMGYTEAISSVVEKHGCRIFCLHPDDVFRNVVKVFYVHITYPDNAFIYVCGASVLFDEDPINAQYGLSEGPGKHVDFMKTMSLECLTQVLTVVCIAVKVPLSLNEDHLPNKGTVTKNITQKLAGEEMPRQTGTPLSFPLMTTSVVPSASHTDFERNMSANMILPFALMTAQEHAIHQLIDELTKSYTDDDEEEVPINQLKRKRFKKATGKTIQADSDNQDRPQCYE
ncbi:hypothetical protein PVK06_026883 [Gossypium arboreum]|uniref:Uncharacterized protein n=1 Tax=Gossypium arboreum TaxID=29729 RepID=A0ABR0P1C0_GOSAR|nr:hypothetical protein PVK06_026883 [Gossypium arboreum]